MTHREYDWGSVVPAGQLANPALERPLAVAHLRRICLVGRYLLLLLTILVGLTDATWGQESAAEVATAKSAQPDSKRPIRVERNLVYREVNGEQVRADLVRPAWASEKAWPVVMMVHGGAWSAGDKWDLLDHARELAQAGYVVVSINYRLAPKAKMAAQVDDCLYAVRWVKAQSKEWKLDLARFGLWGYSAGAHLVSLVALQNPKLEIPVRAVVGGGTPADFSFVPAKSPVLRHVFGATRAEDSEVYEKFSPTSYLRQDAPPFFLFHGDRDFLVPQVVGKRLHDQLVEIGAQSTFHNVEGKGHMLTFLDRDARKLAIQFLNEHLKPDETTKMGRDDSETAVESRSDRDQNTDDADRASREEPRDTRGELNNVRP